MTPTRACMSLEEFTGLVAAAFLGVDADQLGVNDPELPNVPDKNITETEIQSKSRSGTAPSLSWPVASSPSSSPPPPHSFLTTGISSPSFLSSFLEHLDLLDPSTLSSATLIHGRRRHLLGKRDDRTSSTASLYPSNRKNRPRTVSEPRVKMSMSYEYDPLYSSALPIGAGSSHGSKPLALLSKLRRQASALVKPNHSVSATQTTTNGSPSRRKYNTIATTRIHPTVSFAPTPAPSLATFPTSSSTALGRKSTSGISDGDSFLDCEDGRRSFGSRRLAHGKSMPSLSLFRNRNAPFLLNDVGSQQHLHASQEDDVGSISTLETTTSTTEGALSTESGDYIPYIPLVLQHERSITKMRSTQQLSETASFTHPVIPPIGRRTVSGARSTPSPTPSQSTVGSASSTHSPCTPEAAFFGHSDTTPSISVDSDEEEGGDLRSITSSFAPTDGYEFVSNVERKLSHSPFGPPNFEQGSRMSDSARRHPYAQFSEQDEDGDSFFKQARPETSTAAEQGPPPPENDRRSFVSTSSRYSAESYFDPSDMYRRSRMDSLVLPDPSLTGANRLSHTESNFLDHEKTNSSKPLFKLPPDIRVETASTIADLPTPTAATHPDIGNLSMLSPTSLSKSRYQQSHLGVGRQTIDPRSLGTTGKDGEPAEWTLLLGEGEENSFVRARKASQSGGPDATKSGAAVRGRTRSMGPSQERPRKKSGVPGGKASLPTSDMESTLPFAAEPHVQRPLLRIQSIFDTSDSERRESRLSEKDKDQTMRRSGSAHPVLDGGSRDRRSDGDMVDWTLMLPLPFPKRTKHVSANLLSVPSMSPNAGERKKVVHKARSSVDLTTPVTHMRTRKLSSPLLYEKKDGKVMTPSFAQRQQQQQHKKELSAEEMLAAIFESSGASISNVPRSSVDRDDHRQLALNVLSGNSTPSQPASKRPSMSLPSTPKNAVPMTLLEIDNRPPSPSPSVLHFEARLSTLMDQRGVESMVDTENVAASNEDDDVNESNESPEESTPTGTPFLPLPTEHASPPQLSNEPSVLPFPVPSRVSRIYTPPIPSSLPLAAQISLMSAPRPQSHTIRVPIGVARESMTGLSFSQHGPLPVVSAKPSGRPSLDSQPKVLATRNISRPTSLFVAPRRSFASERPRTAPQPSAQHASQARKGCPPITIPVIRGMHLEVDAESGSPTRSSSSLLSASSSTSSASSTWTVTPNGNYLGSASLSSSRQDLFSPATPSLLEDFPLPPASLPLSGVVPTGSTHSSPSKPTLSSLATLGTLTPILGADEDIELPPPTPMTPSGSPRRSPPLRTSPTHDCLSYPSNAYGALNTSMSQWMDDDDDANDDEESRPNSSGETDYEDALSMFAMSDEDYESGVFYSARTSLER